MCFAAAQQVTSEGSRCTPPALGAWMPVQRTPLLSEQRDGFRRERRPAFGLACERRGEAFILRGGIGERLELRLRVTGAEEHDLARSDGAVRFFMIEHHRQSRGHDPAADQVEVGSFDECPGR